MAKHVELAGRADKIVEGRLAVPQADDSTRGTTRRGGLGAGGVGPAGFDSGSARTPWFDTSGA